MKYNDILNLNVSNDIKQIYINIYDDVNNDDEIILEKLRDSLLAAANYNFNESDLFLISYCNLELLLSYSELAFANCEYSELRPILPNIRDLPASIALSTPAPIISPNCFILCIAVNAYPAPPGI